MLYGQPKNFRLSYFSKDTNGLGRYILFGDKTKSKTSFTKKVGNNVKENWTKSQDDECRSGC